MSGGVDSAVAALLLKELGHDVQGVTLRFSQHSACCDATSTARAEAQCAYLKIPWHSVDVQDMFRCQVVEPFWHAMAQGVMPNPCVWCNERVKWQGLTDAADRFGAEFIASGHYARIVHSPAGDQICRGSDQAKDQSYFLYRLSQAQRKRILFPLSGHMKSDVVTLALQSFGPDLVAHRESQDLCFLEKPIAEEVRLHLPAIPGDIVLTDGSVIGRHQGLSAYTIGQRSGLGISGSVPLYVLEKRTSANQLIVGPRDVCMRDRLEAVDLKWQHFPTGELERFEADVVTRYHSRPVKAAIHRIDRDRVAIRLNEAVFAITPGQAVVFYRDQCILGGGTIV
jgi:tRNA-specific 2-thiouridylase